MDRNDILGFLMPERTKQIGFAWSILRESHFAEDAYQDMLKKVFENQGDFEGPKHLRDWPTAILSTAYFLALFFDNRIWMCEKIRR